MVIRQRLIAAWMLAVCCLLVPPVIAHGQPAAATAPPTNNAAATTASLSPQTIDRLRELVRAAMDEHGIPGVSVAVGVNGSLAWTEGFGFADVENQVPVTPESVFRLASISKPITAVAAMRLVESGKLDLDAPVQTYVPEFPARQAPMTTRQLLGHLAGIRHYRAPNEIDSTRRYADSVAALVQFAADDLVAAPGEAYEYSTYGFVLAGAVVERASGLPLMEWIDKCLAASTVPIVISSDDSRRIIPHRVRGYARNNGQLENCHLADTSNKVAGGGMCSRSQDLVVFAQAVMRGELLSNASVDAMWTRGHTSGGKPTTYGLGWFLSPEQGTRRVMHSGGQQGTSTCLIAWPDSGAAVAVMCNLEDAPATELARKLGSVLEPDSK